ncbi:unnamed protein product [Haemonchus placei]|uniref:Uncharacterized protein n=1 Tax=Haemonchus placei TaxID=6290 RepID=A0A3P7WFJ6_HAEPC|nr:unnamed protein product [Haemonchus placei]
MMVSIPLVRGMLLPSRRSYSPPYIDISIETTRGHLQMNDMPTFS